MLGTTLRGRYQIIKHLGGGGFGQTFLAADTQLPDNPVCVVKQLKPKFSDLDTLQTARGLFEKEAKALYKLGNHPQIPQLMADFEEDEQFFLVQEFIDGSELKQELSIGQPLGETQVIALCQEILEILEYVHQQGVIHRDIKPSNLIRRKHDSKIVLIDFGAVKQVSAQISDRTGQTTLTVAVGSPGYMPNEQLGGKPRFCSDIYAVGMLGIQAITGIPASQLPEDPRTSEIIWRDRLPEGTTLASPLLDVLDKMVRYDYRQRYQTVTEALQAFAALSNLDGELGARNQESDVRREGFSSFFANSCLSKQVDTSATYTLYPESAPTQPTDSTTLTLSSEALPSERPVDSQLSNTKTAKKKYHWLKKFGTSIATALALTTGIYYFPKPSNPFTQVPQESVLLNTLTGHSKEVYSIAISPDGKILASGSYDNTIQLWNLPNGKPLRTLSGHTEKVKSVAFSPDGQILASSSVDKTINLWNIRTGELLKTFTGHSSFVLSVAFSPDGQMLASSSADKTIKLWNLRTGKLLRTLQGHSGWVYSVTFSPDGKILANGSDDRTIKLWDVSTGQLMNTIPDPSGNVVRSVTFSPDGQNLVTGSLNAVNLWNLPKLLNCNTAQACQPTRKFSGNLGIVESVTISPDGQTLASGSKDNKVLLWNLKNGKHRSTISNVPGTVNCLTFSPDGKRLVSTGSEQGTIEIWQSPQVVSLDR